MGTKLTMTTKFLLVTFTVLEALILLVEGTDIPSRKGGAKALSLFNIIRFSNSPCAGAGNRNGTCYTEAECTEKRGVSAGSCASGYGVCCTFSATCGQTSRENCTYFESSSVPTGACRLEVCKCDDNVCQLRLDFNSFVIAGPSTSTITVGKQLNGNVAVAATKPFTPATQCLMDRFSVTNPGSYTPPTICGINTGEHMYVDASDACNELSFQLGSASSVNRQWSIKITQYSCSYDNLAPAGCTQYFFGGNTGILKSFNYAGGAHLANQEQKICVRQERGNCRICYFPILETDFIVSGPEGTDQEQAGISVCCAYGTDGATTNGYDCLVIPGALKQDATELVEGSHFCGRKLGTNVIAGETKTVCTDQRPFDITFRSDNFEHSGEAMTMVNEGFRLAYSQASC